MNIIDEIIEKEINNFIKKMETGNVHVINGLIDKIIENMHKNIPDNKRISYGIVYTIRRLAEYIYNNIDMNENKNFDLISLIFNSSDNFRSKSVALGILSFDGIKNFKRILNFFENASKSDDWEVREISQILFRKTIKPNKPDAKIFLLKLVKSDIPETRRFVAETLRPVCENNWFYYEPDYSLSVVRNLFKEPDAYPRTSVGNGLSDLSKKLPELVYDIINELVKNGDKNSYWISYRACRNLVKKDPLKVMDLLKVDEYKYKDRFFKKSDVKK